MIEPVSISPGSIMPPYPWLAKNKFGYRLYGFQNCSHGELWVFRIQQVMRALHLVIWQKQAKQIADNLRKDNIEMEGLEQKN